MARCQGKMEDSPVWQVAVFEVRSDAARCCRPVGWRNTVTRRAFHLDLYVIVVVALYLGKTLGLRLIKAVF